MRAMNNGSTGLSSRFIKVFNVKGFTTNGVCVKHCVRACADPVKTQVHFNHRFASHPARLGK